MVPETLSVGFRKAGICAAALCFSFNLIIPVRAEQQRAPLRLRASGVPTNFGVGPIEEGERQVVEAFRRRFPGIDPVPTTGLVLPGGRSQDMVPFMQIAGDIPPHVMNVNFRQSHTYISMKLLYPLDHYIEALAGVSLSDG